MRTVVTGRSWQKGPETGPVPRDAGVGQGGARENSGWSSRLPEGRKREGGMRDENVTCHRAIKVCHEAGIVGKPCLGDSTQVQGPHHDGILCPHRFSTFCIGTQREGRCPVAPRICRPPASSVLHTPRSSSLSSLSGSSPRLRGGRVAHSPRVAGASQPRPSEESPATAGARRSSGRAAGLRGPARGGRLFLEHMEEKGREKIQNPK